MADEDSIEEKIKSRKLTGSNNTYGFYETPELEEVNDLLSTSQTAFINYFSGLIDNYFQENQQESPHHDPASWYYKALERIILEYYKDNEDVFPEFNTGLGLISNILTDEIFDNLNPKLIDTNKMMFLGEDMENYDYSSLVLSDDNFSRWENNLSKWLKKSEIFVTHYGLFFIEDETEKEKITICPAIRVGMYMVNTGHRLISDYFKKKSFRTIKSKFLIY